MHWFLKLPAQILSIHGGEEFCPSGGDRGDVPCVSSLSPNPKNLNILWNENEVGIGGRNPSKVFIPLERGQVK